MAIGGGLPVLSGAQRHVSTDDGSNAGGPAHCILAPSRRQRYNSLGLHWSVGG